MNASQTVFLNQDRTKAVPEGHPDAKFKLVHQGHEINQAEAEKYEGAVELIGGKKSAHKADSGKVASRDPGKK